MSAKGAKINKAQRLLGSNVMRETKEERVRERERESVIERG